ncbi:MAG: hypothetical protein ABEJ24_03945 [Candidatus Magasanikbacteria bacterium]
MLQKIIEGSDFLRGYSLFAECFFDFSGGGESGCTVKIVNHDNNNKSKIDQFSNDLHFFTYGKYMPIWLGQIMDGINEHEARFYKYKLRPITKILFKKSEDYDLSEALSVFDEETKKMVIQNDASVKLKMQKNIQKPIVRVPAIPITNSLKGQLYLFVILFDYLCRSYEDGYKILKLACSSTLGFGVESNRVEGFQEASYEVVEKVYQKLSVQ